MEPNDIIRIYEKGIFIFNKPVSITGVVRNPGTYILKTEMTLKDLILESGGLNTNVYRYRVEVARIDPLNKTLDQYAEVITFNIDEKFDVTINNSENILDKKQVNSSGNFHLEPYDMVYIRPDPYFNDQKYVTVLGEVLYPGEYVILNVGEKITDVIQRAGGLLPNAYPQASEYIRNGITINASLNTILKNPKSDLNFKIQDGDQIRISSFTNIVSISGEVNTPGYHKFLPKKHLKYYLKQSGGLTPDADRNNIWIEFPNGDSKKYNKYSLISPSVMDGSSIKIGKIKEEEPFDRTEYAKEISAILANLAQAVAVVALATR